MNVREEFEAAVRRLLEEDEVLVPMDADERTSLVARIANIAEAYYDTPKGMLELRGNIDKLGWAPGDNKKGITLTVVCMNTLDNRLKVAQLEDQAVSVRGLQLQLIEDLPEDGFGDHPGQMTIDDVGAEVPWYLDARVIRPDDADLPLKHFWAYAAGYAAACYGVEGECPLPERGDVDGLLNDSWEFGVGRWNARMSWWIHPVCVPVKVQGILAAQHDDGCCPYVDGGDAVAEWYDGFNLAMSKKKKDRDQVAELLAPYLPIIEKLDALPPFPADDEADATPGDASSGTQDNGLPAAANE